MAGEGSRRGQNLLKSPGEPIAPILESGHHILGNANDAVDNRWEVVIPNEDIDKLKGDPEFIDILTLARVTNALNFCFASLLNTKDDTSIVGQRQSFNALLFACATLHEGIEVAKHLQPGLRERESFKDGFVTFFRDRDIRTIRSQVIVRLRNKLVFHFDREELRRVLGTLRLDRCVFQSAKDNSLGSQFYNLADDLVLNHITGESGEADLEIVKFKEIVGSVLRACGMFFVAADNLIGDYILSKGYSAKQTPA